MALPDNERDLWISAVVLSIKDAFTEPASPNDMKTITNQAEAVHFLTDQSGAWAQSRRDICAAIGFCPDRLRKRVIEMKEEGVTQKGLSAFSESILTAADRERAIALAEQASSKRGR